MAELATNISAGEELIRLCRERDLLDLQIAGLAAQFADGEVWDHDGGSNQPPNLTLLCYRHHWNVHEGNWQIVRGDDGRMLTIPPTVRFGLPRGPN